MAIAILYLQFLNVKMYFPVKYRLMQPRFKQQERHFRGFTARRERERADNQSSDSFRRDFSRGRQSPMKFNSIRAPSSRSACIISGSALRKYLSLALANCHLPPPARLHCPRLGVATRQVVPYGCTACGPMVFSMRCAAPLFSSATGIRVEFYHPRP